MSFISNLRTWVQRKSEVNNSLALLREFLSRPSRSGVNVTASEALEISAVLACARLVANGLAQVPLKVFREDGETRLPAKEHPLYMLLHRRPNLWQTSFQWRQTIGLHLMLCEDHYSFINRVRGVPVELLPLPPGSVHCKLASDGYERLYDVVLPNGKTQRLEAPDVLHISGLSWSGWRGLNIVHQAREAIGLSSAIEGEQADGFANGVFASGTYSIEGTLDEKQHQQITNWLKQYASERRGEPLVLDRKAQWVPTRRSNIDADTIASRKFQVQEIARFMGVLPIMIGLDDKSATYAAAEQMFIHHTVHTLGPRFECVEQALDVQLLSEQDLREGYYCKHVVQGLMRGSMKDRAEYLAKALGAGGSPAWLTQDEARGYEELNPMGGAAAKLREPTNVASKASATTDTSDTTPATEGA